MRLNGKQTIYQMIQLAERIRERGGEPREPLWYKHEYLRRLDLRIGGRLDGLAQRRDPARWTSWSTGPERCWRTCAGAACLSTWPAAPTRSFVKQEAELLGLAPLLRPAHLRGAGRLQDASPRRWSSSGSSARTRSGASSLLSFGDGYVEIENTKEVGGLAVAVASDEAHNGSGRVDAWKRERLSGVGADVVIPDFRDADALLWNLILGR